MERFAEAINRLLLMVEELQRDLKATYNLRIVDKERIIRLQEDLEKARAPKEEKQRGAGNVC
jgi:hypothetical protein